MPVGGGGLIAGVGAYVKHLYPEVLVIGVEAEDSACMAAALGAGVTVLDMSGNEMAKLHLRFMVGGRSPAANERLIRFEFPERPGALMRFLTAISGRWNLSLFHYRNHGAAFGRVLAGLQVPQEDAAALLSFLDDLGYVYLGYVWVDETENPAYELFLR